MLFVDLDKLIGTLEGVPGGTKQRARVVYYKEEKYKSK
jgi:hypothetical protein